MKAIDNLDEILNVYYQRIVAAHGEKFAGDPYEFTSRSVKRKLLKWRDEAVVDARIDELLYLTNHCDPLILDRVWVQNRIAQLTEKGKLC